MEAPGELGNSPSTRALPRRSLPLLLSLFLSSFLSLPSLSSIPLVSPFSSPRLVHAAKVHEDNARSSKRVHGVVHGRLRNRLSATREVYRPCTDDSRLIVFECFEGHTTLEEGRLFLGGPAASITR